MNLKSPWAACRDCGIPFSSGATPYSGAVGGGWRCDRCAPVSYLRERPHALVPMTKDRVVNFACYS